MDDKERGLVIPGRPISEEIILSIPVRYVPDPSVVVGETVCENVANFINEMIPIELMDYYFDAVNNLAGEEDYVFEDEL